MTTGVHSVPGLPLLGSFFEYRRDKIGFLSSLRDDGRPLTAFRLGKHNITLLKRPEDLIHVEHRNAKNYHKATMLRDLVGDGILMSDGEKWRKQRRLIQPRFHPSSVAALEGLMNRKIDDFIRVLADRSKTQDHPIEIGMALKKMVFEIILEALFGEVDHGDFSELQEPMEFMNFFLTYRFNELFPLPLSLPLPRYLKFQKARREIDRVIYRYIERKKKEIRSGRAGVDLLTQMIQSVDTDTGIGMDELQLRDETVSILLAGFETTGNLLSWILVNLGSHPAVLGRLIKEIDSDIGSSVPRAENVLALSYLSCVMDETLRLQPPVWAWTKRALGEDSLGDYRIAKGQILFLSPYLVHRDPRLWRDASGFDPDRWTQELREKTKGAYFPFGMGPRTCVGRHFAVLEAKLIVVRLLQSFEYRISEGNIPEPEFRITLGLKTPLHVFLKPRRNHA
ncbi:MAG: cytochrome P450 [Bdellovibrionales bacterium]|nr:cytochrome P450 [Bdellovibrionales bacterium]